MEGVQTSTEITVVDPGGSVAEKPLEETKLLDVLRDVRTKRADDGKPLAVAMIDALKAPPPEDILAMFEEGKTPTADEWRKLLSGMAIPKREETLLEAGANTLARKFAAGDSEAVRIVRDALDGRPAQEILSQHNETKTIQIVARIEKKLFAIGLNTAQVSGNQAESNAKLDKKAIETVKSM